MIISEMQRKLATWAATDPSLRIQRLLRLITQPEWLAEAARITLSSKGAHTPGVDGVNKTMLQARLAVELQILRDELLSGHYQPLPARRVYIPKSNGKLRPLGIPALRDRIVQRAMLMAMEPIWESDFHTLSYGFRPERSVHHAIRTVKLQLTDCGETRGRWVIEGDLSSYFDTVHHRLLMKAVRRRISDARFMTLLWKTIKAGHIDVGLFRAASEGVPQGGVISPLLSNIMLNEFDQYLHERYLSGKARKDRWYWNNSENTMASVDSCIKYGVGNIECDVCISKDSVFYVLHDSTLDRTTNGTGAISQWLSTDIDTLDAGSWFAPRFAGQRVLRLTDLLRKAKEHGLRITIDYRNGGLHQLLNLIKDEGMLENCNFTFSKEYHAKCFRKMAPEVRTLQAYIKSEKDIEHVVKELHPDIAVVWIDSLTPQFVKKCREHNLQVLALVLGLDDKTEENQKAVDLGVDIIATDHPEKFIMKYGKPSI